MLTFDDVRRLEKVLASTAGEAMLVEADGLRVEVEHRPAVTPGPATAPAPSGPAAAGSTGVTRACQLCAPAAGEVHWTEDPETLRDSRVGAGSVLAHVVTGGTRRPVTASMAGRVVYCTPLADGAFVEYRQWLVSIEP